MDFPIIDLLDEEMCVAWLREHFHPEGMKCPHCGAPDTDARFFRVNRGSGLEVFRCRKCQGVYHLYSGTVFEGSQLTPMPVVLLIRGILQGKTSAKIAREVDLTRKTVLKWRHRLQANAEKIQPETPLPDQETESDEMFQNAGEKGWNTSILPTHRVTGPTNGGAEVHSTMIAHPF